MREKGAIVHLLDSSSVGRLQCQPLGLAASLLSLPRRLEGGHAPALSGQGQSQHPHDMGEEGGSKPEGLALEAADATAIEEVNNCSLLPPFPLLPPALKLPYPR